MTPGSPKVLGHLTRQQMANLPLQGTLIRLCLRLKPVDDAVIQVAYGQVAYESLQLVGAMLA